MIRYNKKISIKEIRNNGFRLETDRGDIYELQPVYSSKATVQISNKNQASKVLSMSQAYEDQNSLAEAIEIF